MDQLVKAAIAGAIDFRRCGRNSQTQRRKRRSVRDIKIDGLQPADTRLRSSTYLNNLIERDHRGVTLRIDPMLGFK
jgi:transposase-like protein